MDGLCRESKFASRLKQGRKGEGKEKDIKRERERERERDREQGRKSMIHTFNKNGERTASLRVDARQRTLTIRCCGGAEGKERWWVQSTL